MNYKRWDLEVVQIKQEKEEEKDAKRQEKEGNAKLKGERKEDIQKEYQI